mmetsp:Transcript_31774/g.98315  ORF Transcript_31774/g.98315 Transcript_31774/m.98315 type:complete len:206 (+) Transcript_31774:418-1035(+)
MGIQTRPASNFGVADARRNASASASDDSTLTAMRARRISVTVMIPSPSASFARSARRSGRRPHPNDWRKMSRHKTDVRARAAGLVDASSACCACSSSRLADTGARAEAARALSARAVGRRDASSAAARSDDGSTFTEATWRTDDGTAMCASARFSAALCVFDPSPMSTPSPPKSGGRRRFGAALAEVFSGWPNMFTAASGAAGSW